MGTSDSEDWELGQPYSGNTADPRRPLDPECLPHSATCSSICGLRGPNLALQPPNLRDGTQTSGAPNNSPNPERCFHQKGGPT